MNENDWPHLTTVSRWQRLLADSEGRRQKLLLLQEQYRQIEDLYLTFAKKASAFNSWFENAEEDLTDPVRCNSVEEIKVGGAFQDLARGSPDLEVNSPVLFVSVFDWCTDAWFLESCLPLTATPQGCGGLGCMVPVCVYTGGPCSQDHMQNQESASSKEGGILGQEFIDVEVWRERFQGKKKKGLIREGDFHRDGLSSGWYLIRVVFQQGGLSSGWSVIRVVFYH